MYHLQETFGFFNIFKGCLDWKVKFYVITAEFVLRQKPFTFWLLLPPSFSVCHVLVPGVPGWASGWNFRVCVSPRGRWKYAEFAWQRLPGQELLRSSLEHGECVGCWAWQLRTHLQGCGWCATITCTALKNSCYSKWRDLAKALDLSCLIICFEAIGFCVSIL